MKIKKCCIALKGVFLLGSGGGGGLKTVVSIVTIQVNTEAAMWARLNGCGDLTFSLHCSFEPKEHINFLEEIHQASEVNIYYYSLKIFPQFWLAKSTRLIHHNQLLLTKFGRILCLTRKWRKKCSLLQVNEPLTEKTWGRGWVVLAVKTKWPTLHSF